MEEEIGLRILAPPRTDDITISYDLRLNFGISVVYWISLNLHGIGASGIAPASASWIVRDGISGFCTSSLGWILQGTLGFWVSGIHSAWSLVWIHVGHSGKDHGDEGHR